MKWISLEEQTPEEAKAYVILYWNKHTPYSMATVAFLQRGVWYLTSTAREIEGKVTHWCKLPSRDGLEKPDFNED